MATLQKIYPFLWFENQATEAAEYYTAIFPDSKIISLSPMVSEFEILGMQFKAMNAGPQFHFTEAISFMVQCEDQKEVDYYWNSLTANGGIESKCGWLKDRYGLSWQIIPKRFMELMGGEPEKAQKVMTALMGMNKLIVTELEEAYNR